MIPYWFIMAICKYISYYVDNYDVLIISDITVITKLSYSQSRIIMHTSFTPLGKKGEDALDR